MLRYYYYDMYHAYLTLFFLLVMTNHDAPINLIFYCTCELSFHHNFVIFEFLAMDAVMVWLYSFALSVCIPVEYFHPGVMQRRVLTMTQRVPLTLRKVLVSLMIVVISRLLA